MFNIVQKAPLVLHPFRHWSSCLALVIMIYSTVTTGAPFRLSIDFLGGSIYELKFDEGGRQRRRHPPRLQFAIGDDNVIIQQYRQCRRTSVGRCARVSTTSAVTEDILTRRLSAMAPINRDSFRVETVSATIGQEVTRSALAAVAVGALVITGFIVIAFRQVPNAIRYGVVRHRRYDSRHPGGHGGDVALRSAAGLGD